MDNKNKTISLGLKSTRIRNRIHGEKKRPLSHLEKRLILNKWAKSQEGSMAKKLYESKQFLKTKGITI